MASSNWRRLRSAPQQHQAAPLPIKTNQHAVQAHERKIEHPASPLPNTSTALPCASRRRIIPIARSRSSVPPIAVSSLGGFRTPAAEHPRCFSSGRHPKPFTKAVIRLSAHDVRLTVEQQAHDIDHWPVPALDATDLSESGLPLELHMA